MELFLPSYLTSFFEISEIKSGWPDQTARPADFFAVLFLFFDLYYHPETSLQLLNFLTGSRFNKFCFKICLILHDFSHLILKFWGRWSNDALTGNYWKMSQNPL